MTVTERILLMGGPGTGKTQQIINVCNWISGQGKEMYLLDLEDKVEAFLSRTGSPGNLHLRVALTWEEVREVVDVWKKEVKPGNWIAVDRVDILWPLVQRWYTQARYKEELADRMVTAAKAVPGTAMLIPRFPQGAWQVINEQYEYIISNLLYLYRCNVLLTSGVTAPREDVSPFETFSSVGVAPRGQKELAHQPHTALLLSNEVQRDREKGVIRTWHVTTAKDLPGRGYLQTEPLFDLAVQYLEPLLQKASK